SSESAAFATLRSRVRIPSRPPEATLRRPYPSLCPSSGVRRVGPRLCRRRARPRTDLSSTEQRLCQHEGFLQFLPSHGALSKVARAAALATEVTENLPQNSAHVGPTIGRLGENQRGGISLGASRRRDSQKGH